MDSPKKEIKICIVCKTALTEVIKDVYKCIVCKAILNERLNDKQ